MIYKKFKDIEISALGMGADASAGNRRQRRGD